MGTCFSREDQAALQGETDAAEKSNGVSTSRSTGKQFPVAQPPASSNTLAKILGSGICILLLLGVLPSFTLRLTAAVCIFASWALFGPSSVPQHNLTKAEIEAGADGFSRTGTAEGLPCFRVQDEEASKLRARGEDPYIAQRLNYLQGTTVPFAPLLSELNEKQQRKFTTFEQEFEKTLDADGRLDRQKFHQMPDRFTMLLFLQADGYKVDLGMKRLVDTMVWRQQFGVDDFIDNPDWKAFNHYLKYRTKRILGFDKSGRPLLLERLGEFFGSDNGEKALPRETWTMMHAFELSLIGAAFRTISVRKNRAHHRLAYCGDLAGLRWRQASATMPFLKYITQGVERYFPETAGAVIMFNAPGWLGPLFAGVKLFLDKNTVANIHLFSGVPSKDLRDIVGPQVLPQEWGGELDYVVPHIPDL